MLEAGKWEKHYLSFGTNDIIWYTFKFGRSVNYQTRFSEDCYKNTSKTTEASDEDN